jgi:cystathionine gamma-lyase
MTDNQETRAARLLHLRGRRLAKGEPVGLPMTATTMYHLPGDPTGFRQYGRFDNPTWEATEEMLAHLEDAPALAFPSGMAAIAAVFY